MSANEISIGRYGGSTYWRATAVPPRLAFFDYRVSVIILPLIFYFRLPLIVTAFCLIVVLSIFERRNIGPDNILLWIRSVIAGDRIPPNPRSASRQAIDYGFEDVLPDSAMDAFRHRESSSAESARESGSAWREALSMVPILGGLARKGRT